jgi:3,4-dihydroxy 2-butanone 4-phosphate synthase / GTP cyclohydrolase II
MAFETVIAALQQFRAGKMVVVVDDEDRENEGDLCVAADRATPDMINFMAVHGRGLICLALTGERCDALRLPMMVTHNTSKHHTAFTVSIEAVQGVSTGISAADRARTIQVAIDPASTSDDLAQPGHVFPLRAKKGGVLVRSGHTEAAVDLARLAGLQPAGVICEIMNDDGSMARMPDLRIFAAKHELPIISIAELIEYRVAHESLVTSLAVREVVHPIWGDVVLHAFGTSIDERQHLAVVKGDIHADPSPLVRVHSGYPLAHVFGDLFMDERRSLKAALSHLGREDRGVLLCLDQGASQISLVERLNHLGETNTKENQTTPMPVQREIGVGAQILRALGLSRIRVLTNHPRHLKGIEGFGLSIEEVIPLDMDGADALPLPKFKVVGHE